MWILSISVGVMRHLDLGSRSVVVDLFSERMEIELQPANTKETRIVIINDIIMIKLWIRKIQVLAVQKWKNQFLLWQTQRFCFRVIAPSIPQVWNHIQIHHVWVGFSRIVHCGVACGDLGFGCVHCLRSQHSESNHGVSLKIGGSGASNQVNGHLYLRERYQAVQAVPVLHELQQPYQQAHWRC